MIVDRILGLFSRDLGIDLGTANTLVVCRGESGIAVNEPSVVAIQKGTNIVLNNGEAVGIEAKRMLGKAPLNIEVIRPMKDGVIADFKIAEAMISYFIRKAHNRSWLLRPRVLIAVPLGSTGVERRAVFNSAERAGARKVYLVEQPRAAGLGAGLPIAEPKANMVVDIGGGTTQVAVISLADVAAAHTVKIAGDKFDEAIISHMKRAYNLLIGEQTAERIKLEIGSAFPLEKEMTLEVRGMDAVDRLPSKETISSEEIREALREPLAGVIEAVRKTLEKTPPELAADLVEEGMTLTGGGALLRGLDKLLERECGLPVRVANDPLTCVARGTGMFLENLDLYASILESGDSE